MIRSKRPCSCLEGRKGRKGRKTLYSVEVVSSRYKYGVRCDHRVGVANLLTGR
jgi:hypothetical protein